MSEKRAALGQRVQTYRFNPVKSVLNFIIAAGLILSGGFIVSGQMQFTGFDAFALLGSILTLVGLLMAWLLYRQVRSYVQVYENGVIVPEGTWLFSELDISQAVGRASARSTGIRVPQQTSFFADDRLVFAISSNISDWQAAAGQVQAEILRVQLPKLIDRLRKGEVITFDKIQAGDYFAPKPFPLSFSREGILLPDMTFLGWMLIRGVTMQYDRWNSLAGIIRLNAGGEIAFNLENSRQSIIAYHLLATCLKTKLDT